MLDAAVADGEAEDVAEEETNIADDEDITVDSLDVDDSDLKDVELEEGVTPVEEDGGTIVIDEDDDRVDTEEDDDNGGGDGVERTPTVTVLVTDSVLVD